MKWIEFEKITGAHKAHLYFLHFCIKKLTLITDHKKNWNFSGHTMSASRTNVLFLFDTMERFTKIFLWFPLPVYIDQKFFFPHTKPRHPRSSFEPRPRQSVSAGKGRPERRKRDKVWIQQTDWHRKYLPHRWGIWTPFTTTRFRIELLIPVPDNHLVAQDQGTPLCV